MTYHAYNIQNIPNFTILRKTALKFTLHIIGKRYNNNNNNNNNTNNNNNNNFIFFI